MAMTEGALASFAGGLEELFDLKRRHREDGEVSAEELALEDTRFEQLRAAFGEWHLEYQISRAVGWGGFASPRAQALIRQLAAMKGQLYVFGPAATAAIEQGADLLQLLS